MSIHIMHELYFLAHSMILGVLITFLYDWLRILRRIIRHNLLFISIEDFIFWFFCSIEIFFMLFQENNGILRWFAVIGAMGGMFVYKLLLGKIFVHLMVVIISRVIHTICFIMKKIIIPFKKLFIPMIQVGKKQKIKVKRGVSIGKNRLTSYLKMIKMILRKQ